MAINLSSSHPQFYSDHQSFCNSLSPSYILQSSPSSLPWRPKHLNHSLTLFSTSFKSHSRSSIFQNVSLQDSIHQDSQNPSSNPSQNQNPDERPRNHVWVNPKRPKAAQLRLLSYNSRYAFLLKVAESLDSCNPTEEDVVNVLSGIGENPLQHDAVTVLNNMNNPETAVLALDFFLKIVKRKKEVILYNITFKVLRKSRNFDKAEILFNEMIERGVKPDSFTFRTMISCARMSNLPHKAVEVFQKMPGFGCDPDDITSSAMIDAYGRMGDMDMALSFYDRARTEKWRIDLVTFSTLIKIYGISGNFDGALNVYEEIKALGIKPNLLIYNTLLHAMGRAKRPWQAKHIYEEMISNGFVPNRATYAALLRAFARSRYGEDGLKVYREMKNKGYELNVNLYNTILSMCADIGYTDEAVEIFEDFKKSETCKPDSWTFSSLITTFSCSGRVSEAENMLNQMLEAGFEPNIYVLTSMIQCYGKACQIDDVVKTFNQVQELGITPDGQFCACLLAVMTQLPKKELGKIIECIEKANPKWGSVVKLLVDEETDAGVFRQEATELFGIISDEVKKSVCNCLIDLCVNLELLDKACVLLDMGITLEIYGDIQSKSPTQWSLHLKTLSTGAALTALHIWMNDLTKALEDGEELPPLLGINTGHGKHKYLDQGLASVLGSHLRELDAPFHESPEKAGWFLTTKMAAKSWLESRRTPELVSA